MTTLYPEGFRSNAVIELSRHILKLRGKDPRTCSLADLSAAYDRAEKVVGWMARTGERIIARARKDAA